MQGEEPMDLFQNQPPEENEPAPATKKAPARKPKRKKPSTPTDSGGFQWLQLKEAPIGEGTPEFALLQEYEDKQQQFLDNARDFIRLQQERKFLFDQTKPRHQQPPILATMSGKGGSGKTSFALSLSVYLASLGKRVYLVDLDFYTAGLSFYFNGTEEFDAKGRSHLTIDELMQKVAHGEYNHDLLNSAEKPFIVKISKNPRSIRLAENLYVTLGSTRSTRLSPVDSIQQQTRHFLLMETILKYIINPVNFDDTVDVILLDLGAGPFVETILPYVSHPIFVTEGDKVSMKAIERLRESWAHARGFEKPGHWPPQEEAVATAQDGLSVESMPFLLLSRVNGDNMGVVERDILPHIRGYYVLPPLPYTGIFRESAASYEFVRYLATALPYSLQILESIRILFPGILPTTSFEARYDKIRHLFENSRMRLESNQLVDFENTDEVREIYQDHLNLLGEHQQSFWQMEPLEQRELKWDARISDEEDPESDEDAYEQEMFQDGAEKSTALDYSTAEDDSGHSGANPDHHGEGDPQSHEHQH